MKYKINAFIIYDAVDGTLSLKKDEVDTQLSITANALLFYMIQKKASFPVMKCLKLFGMIMD